MADLLRAEVRPDVPAVLSFRPSVAGTGDVVSTSATFTVHAPDGAQLATGTASIVAVDSVSRIDVPVQVSDLEEGYQARITWRASGESNDRFHIIPFDCVRWPWAEELLTKSEITDARGAVDEVITDLAELTNRSPEAEVDSVARHVRRELRDMVRNASDIDGEPLRAALVLNRDRLRVVEVMLALREIYSRTMTGDVEDDSAAALYAHYDARVAKIWEHVGQKLEYDTDGDLTPDEEANAADPNLGLEVTW